MRGTARLHKLGDDGHCYYCGAPLTMSTAATQGAINMATDAYDDRIGPQMPWESDQCPARGPELSHYIDNHPVGTCSECKAEVIMQIDLGVAEDRPADNPVPGYLQFAKYHSRETKLAFRQRRPILSAKHSWALDILARAGLAEELNPEPRPAQG